MNDLSFPPATATGTTQPGTRRQPIPMIDCDMHNYIASDAALLPYLDPAWHAHHREYGPRSHVALGFAGAPYPRSNGGGKRHDTKPPSGLPVGADFEFFKENHFDLHGFQFGILNCLSRVGDQLNDQYDGALARAMNDWLVKEWLERDARMRASLLIPYENAELSVAELERIGKHPGFAQVFIRARVRDPLGSMKYWKIYECAEQLGLPVAIHFAGMSRNPITSSGWGSYYIEDHTTMSQAFQSHLISLVCNGVFERFPKLRVVLIEGGFAWLPPLMWRLDKHWRRLRSEVPHVRRLPSETIREHVRLTTMPMEEPAQPRHLLRVIEHLGSEEMLMFASDYPHWDYDNPERAFQVRLPDALRRKIYFDNANALYRFTSGKA